MENAGVPKEGGRLCLKMRIWIRAPEATKSSGKAPKTVKAFTIVLEKNGGCHYIRATVFGFFCRNQFSIKACDISLAHFVGHVMETGEEGTVEILDVSYGGSRKMMDYRMV